MAAFVVDPKAVHEFKYVAALDRWYAKNHAKAPEMWIKIHKKGSGLKSVTNVEGFEVALCWGWIDAIRKSLDAECGAAIEKNLALGCFVPRPSSSRSLTMHQPSSDGDGAGKRSGDDHTSICSAPGSSFGQAGRQALACLLGAAARSGALACPGPIRSA